MENATKALLIAAGVLIGMLILSLGVYLYYSIGVYVERAQEQIAIQELDKFNTQFYNYQAVENEIFSFQDVITAANLAYENNKKYDFPVAKFNSNLILDNKDNLKNAISEGNDNLVNGGMHCLVSSMKDRFSIPSITKSRGDSRTSTENFCLSGFTSNKSFSRTGKN